MPLSTRSNAILKFWLPPFVNAVIACVLLIVIGNTPLVRSIGLALAIMGVAAALRRMGAVLSTIGSLTLCVSPAFWSQTGGGQGEPATIVVALIAAGLAVGIGVMLSQRPYIGLGIGVVIFASLFFAQIGTPRSLRLTAFVTAWLLYLVIDMLLITNPHPEDQAPPILLDTPMAVGAALVRPYHTFGILLLLGIGVLNDPLVTLLAPAIVLSLWLARAPLRAWFWCVLAGIVALGIRGFAADYLDAQGYLLALDRWRDADRWIAEVRLVVGQFGVIGIALGVLGLARLARWYPPLGGVTLIAYTAYTFFGLVYLGGRREVLLLPLFIVQVVWMTYAVFTLSEWLGRAFQHHSRTARATVQIAYALAPLILLLNGLN